MRRVVAGLVIVASGLTGQDHLEVSRMPERRVEGRVIDELDNPIAGASLDHIHEWKKKYESDAVGKFKLKTRTPSFVIRKAGFRSVFVRLPIAMPLVVKMAIDVYPPMNECPAGAPLYEATGMVRFWITPGVQLSRSGDYLDAHESVFRLETKQGPETIHGYGMSWDEGFPNDVDVWRSVQYHERRLGGWLEAQGQFVNGRRWRYLGRENESASYHNADEESAKIFDRFFDSACYVRTR